MECIKNFIKRRRVKKLIKACNTQLQNINAIKQSLNEAMKGAE